MTKERIQCIIDLTTANLTTGDCEEESEALDELLSEVLRLQGEITQWKECANQWMKRSQANHEEVERLREENHRLQCSINTKEVVHPPAPQFVHYVGPIEPERGVQVPCKS